MYHFINSRHVFLAIASYQTWVCLFFNTQSTALLVTYIT